MSTTTTRPDSDHHDVRGQPLGHRTAALRPYRTTTGSWRLTFAGIGERDDDLNLNAWSTCGCCGSANPVTFRTADEAWRAIDRARRQDDQ